VRSPRQRPGVVNLENSVAQPGEVAQPAAEPAYRLARVLGLFGLMAGLVLAVQLEGFNPFLGIPLLLGCGAIGYLLGYQIENWGRG